MHTPIWYCQLSSIWSNRLSKDATLDAEFSYYDLHAQPKTSTLIRQLGLLDFIARISLAHDIRHWAQHDPLFRRCMLDMRVHWRITPPVTSKNVFRSGDSHAAPPSHSVCQAYPFPHVHRPFKPHRPSLPYLDDSFDSCAVSPCTTPVRVIASRYVVISLLQKRLLHNMTRTHPLPMSVAYHYCTSPR